MIEELTPQALLLGMAFVVALAPPLALALSLVLLALYAVRSSGDGAAGRTNAPPCNASAPPAGAVALAATAPVDDPDLLASLSRGRQRAIARVGIAGLGVCGDDRAGADRRDGADALAVRLRARGMGRTLARGPRVVARRAGRRPRGRGRGAGLPLLAVLALLVLACSFAAGWIVLRQVRRSYASKRANDRDGLYRINSLFCHADTWQAALAALVAQRDRVLMDLRSFGIGNAGCTAETQHLVHRVPLTRCL
jgi:hypothetical protein